MEETTLGLIFVIAGILMLIVEASSPGFFIGIPATIVLILGIIGMAVPDIFFTWVSPVIAVGVGVPMTYVTSEPYIGHLGLGGVGDSKGMLESEMRAHHINWVTNAKVVKVEEGRMFVEQYDDAGHKIKDL